MPETIYKKRNQHVPQPAAHSGWKVTMNKLIFLLAIIILVASTAVFYVLSDYFAPMISIWVLIFVASVVVVFGFLLGIKFMSEL